MQIGASGLCGGIELCERFSNDGGDNARLSTCVGVDSRLPPREFQGSQDGQRTSLPWSWPCEDCLNMVFSSHTSNVCEKDQELAILKQVSVSRGSFLQCTQLWGGRWGCTVSAYLVPQEARSLQSKAQGSLSKPHLFLATFVMFLTMHYF